MEPNQSNSNAAAAKFKNLEPVLLHLKENNEKKNRIVLLICEVEAEVGKHELIAILIIRAGL